MAKQADANIDHWETDQIFRSVTLYPWATMDAEATVRQLIEHEVNTVFVIIKESDGRVFYDSDVAPSQVPQRDILADLVRAAKQYDLRLIPSIFVLCDKYLTEQYPETVQVAREGTEIRYPNVSMEWMHWVCPNHEIVRNHLRAVVEELTAYDIDGIQFTHFEFQPIMNGESSYQSCFCEECVTRSESRDVPGESNAWVEMRCESTTSLLDDLSASLCSSNEQIVDIEFEVFANLDTAVEDSRETLGVDQPSLMEFADIVTPRTSHVDLDMHPLWIRDVVRSFRAMTDTPIVPSIRTAAGETPSERLSADELVTAIQMALHGGAQGVSLFSAGANVGRLTPTQWTTTEEMFEELARFEREYGLPSN